MNTFEVGDQVVVTREHANFNIGDVVTITKVWAGSLHCTKDGGPECSVAITKVQALPSIAKVEALLEVVRTILKRSTQMQAVDEFAVDSGDMKYLRYTYEGIVPPKTTGQLLQDLLDAADAYINFKATSKYAEGHMSLREKYDAALAAYEASKQ